MTIDEPPILELAGLQKTFGVTRAVVDGNLTLRSGEAVALIGANGAGKSTLMNMLGGIVRPDAGEIRVHGRAVELRSPRDAARAGIAFVQQELAVFPTLSVAENVFADDYPVHLGRIDRARMAARTEELLAAVGADLDPARPLEGLSTGACQMVEIARAMRSEPKIVIFDEPTSSLSAREKERFHQVVHRLKASGVAIVYITHFINEIFGTCDRVCVMRNGAMVADAPVNSVSHAELVDLMLGEVVADERLVPDDLVHDDAVLTVENLTLPGQVEDASFTLHRGEIVGLWGLLGSGRTELARAVLGLDGPPSGRLTLHAGSRSRVVRPEEVRRITAFVTEDRKGEGLLMPFSVARNVALPNLETLAGRLGWVRRGALRTLTAGLIRSLAIKVFGPQQRVGTLSGGNQQKVVLAKWLASRPEIVILDEPTRGLDLSAKADVLRLASELAREGAAILIISSELEELMRISHRYLIMQERRLVGELDGDADEAALIAALSREPAPQASGRAA